MLVLPRALTKFAVTPQISLRLGPGLQILSILNLSYPILRPIIPYQRLHYSTAVVTATSLLSHLKAANHLSYWGASGGTLSLLLPN